MPHPRTCFMMVAALAISACAPRARATAPTAHVYRDGRAPIAALIDKLPRTIAADEPIHLPVLTGTVFADVMPAFYDAAWRLVTAHGPTSLMPTCLHTCADLEGLTKDVIARAADVNARLANAGLGYYFALHVGSDPAERVVHWLPFLVEHVAIVETAAARRRVLGLRPWIGASLPADVSTDYLGLGITLGGTPALLLDNIEQNSATRLVGFIADEPVTTEAPALYRLTGPTSAAIRADLLRALGRDADAAVRVARLLHERLRLADSRSTSERRLAIEHSLDRLEAPRIIARITELLSDEVALHEAQHATDWARSTPLSHPAALAATIPGDSEDVAANVE